MDRLNTRAALLAGLCAIALTAGCASAPPPAPENRSYAGSILDDAQFAGIPDVSTPSETSDTRRRGSGLGSALGLTNLAVGSPVVGLLLLGGSGAPDPWNDKVRIFAKAPPTFADSPEVARQRFGDLVENAFLEALETGSFQSDPVITLNTEYGSYEPGSDAGTLQVQWTHHECDPWVGLSRCRLFVEMLPEAPPHRGVSPSEIDGSEPWLFDYFGGMVSWFPIGMINGRRHATVDALSLYKAVSEQLPDWAYLYVPPGRVGYRSENGEIVHFPAPVLLNRGLAHFFVEGARQGDAVVLEGWRDGSGPIVSAPASDGAS